MLMTGRLCRSVPYNYDAIAAAYAEKTHLKIIKVGLVF